MRQTSSVENATVGGASTLIGRRSMTRAEWEAARAEDAADLNRLQEKGGEVEAYVVSLWSNEDVGRCLAELRGFDDAQVYVEPVVGDGFEDVLGAIAESEWAGAAYLGGDISLAAAFVHASAGLEFRLFVPQFDCEKALALAITEDLTPREIEAVLGGAGGEPDSDALDHARELLA